MTQIAFVRWCVDPKGRTPISVDPTRVDCTEHYMNAFQSSDGEKFPAATRIIMKGKQEFIVQGDFADMVALLNAKSGA